MTSKCPYALSSDPTIAALQRRWLIDRQKRRHVPPSRSWRGCVGLAMLLDRVEDTEYCAGRALIPNDHVTWLALRDVPAGHFPGSGPVHRRGVSYVNSGRATLRYGMLSIDLSQSDRNALDFRFFPGARRRDNALSLESSSVEYGDVLHPESRLRELEMLVRLSESMTKFSTSSRQRSRQRRDLYQRPVRNTSNPASWMPVAYLGLSGDAAQSLIEQSVARPSLSVRDAFCDAVADGVPLLAHDDSTYVGVQQPRQSNSTLTHVLSVSATGRRRCIELPCPAEVLVHPGEEVEAGKAWCRLMPKPPESWARQHPRDRWRTLSATVSNPKLLHARLRLWLCDRTLRIDSMPHLQLFPAELACDGGSGLGSLAHQTPDAIASFLA